MAESMGRAAAKNAERLPGTGKQIPFRARIVLYCSMKKQEVRP